MEFQSKTTNKKNAENKYKKLRIFFSEDNTRIRRIYLGFLFFCNIFDSFLTDRLMKILGINLEKKESNRLLTLLSFLKELDRSFPGINIYWIYFIGLLKTT